MISAATARRIVLGVAGMLVSFNGAAQTSDDQLRLVEANTRFSFKLFHQLVSRTADKNVLVSPTGLSLTFALLDNGADSGTREEIESAFEFKGLDLVGINEGAKALRAALQLAHPIAKDAKKPFGVTPQQWRASQAMPPNGTVIADSLWLNNMNFPETFLKVNRDYYGADVKRFMATPSPSLQISRWATERTRKGISITPGRMLKNAFLFVDVTHFREFWKHDFLESATKLGTFTLASGTTKQVPFMYQTEHFSYFEDEKFQAVILPYSYLASMLIFLPSEQSSLKEFEQTLSAENWQQWQPRFDSRMGTVGLPRLQMETGFDVRAALEELGVKRAFESSAAFKPIAPLEGARLENAIQKTQLRVDERGTEAVSIGMIGGVPGGVAGGMIGGPPPPPPFKMIMNRPFFFAIVNKPSGQLLFLGAVMEP
jgi:serine protease inhibitor